jgi:hypothetical protein
VVSGVACGAGAGALWGLVFLTPDLARDFSALQLTSGRYLVFGMISAVLIAPRWRDVVSRVTRRQWWALVWLAYCGNGLYYIHLSTAVHYGGVALTALMNGCLPVVVTLVGIRDEAAVPLRRLVPSLLLCLGGFVCIGWQALSLPAPGAVLREAVALLCSLGAVACWASYAVINSRHLGADGSGRHGRLDLAPRADDRDPGARAAAAAAGRSRASHRCRLAAAGGRLHRPHPGGLAGRQLPLEPHEPSRALDAHRPDDRVRDPVRAALRPAARAAPAHGDGGRGAGADPAGVAVHREPAPAPQAGGTC